MLTILAFLLRLFGFVSWAASLERKWAAKRAAEKHEQKIADVPDSDKEWMDAAKRGDL